MSQAESAVRENILVDASLLRVVSGGPPRVVGPIDSAVDRGEVIRYVGYPGGKVPSDRVQQDIDRWIDVAHERAEARASFLVLPVEQVGRRELHLRTGDGVAPFKGAIGEFLGPVRMVALFVATAGPRIEQLASELMEQGDELAALIVNAVGAERAEAAESVVIELLREWAHPEGLAPTLPYSPGYCGMALAEQRKLFSLFGDQTVGVTLTEDCLMRPLKSVSGLIGLGPADEVEAHGSPCDRCELYSCAMRR